LFAADAIEQRNCVLTIQTVADDIFIWWVWPPHSMICA